MTEDLRDNAEDDCDAGDGIAKSAVESEAKLLESGKPASSEFHQPSPGDSNWHLEDGPTLKLEEEDLDPLIGTVIVGRYEIVSRLSKSPTSAVYKANHLLMDRPVALRLLVASDIQSVKRFQIEAKIASNLDHTNIVTVHDFGVSQGRPFLTCDFLEGKSLADLISERGQISASLILDIFTQVCDALNYVHKQDLLCRFLKPTKIMLTETSELADIVKLCDFGISERLIVDGKEVNNLANSGILYADPNYMSPEFCLAVKLDARSDVYSLGCVMYEALTGAPPFDDSSPARIMHKQVTKEPPPIDRPDVPEQLLKVVSRALEKDPDRRYRTIESMWTELEVVKHGIMQKEGRVPRQLDAARARQAHQDKGESKVRKMASFAGLVLIGVLIGLSATQLKSLAPSAVKSGDQKRGWQELNKEGEEAFERGHYQESERLLGRALAKAGGFDPDDPRTATTLNNLGALYFTMDLYPEAENALRKALSIRERTLGIDNLDVAATLDDLSMVLLVQGRTKEAEPMVKRAYEIRKKVLKPDHEDIAQSLQVMASLYHRQGRLKDAMAALKRALFIRKHALGTQHPDVATTYNSLGMQHQLAGNYGEARACYDRANEIGVTVYGEEHPIVADSLVGLGTVDFIEGKYASAHENFTKALQIRETVLGRDSFRVGEVLSCLGILDERQGRLSSAESNLRRAVEIYENALGPNSAELSRSVKNLARVLRREGKRREAQALDKRLEAGAVEQGSASSSSAPSGSGLSAAPAHSSSTAGRASPGNQAHPAVPASSGNHAAPANSGNLATPATRAVLTE